jgi:truncated hemoglobin YjbI
MQTTADAAAIQSAVTRYVERVRDDPVLAPYIREVDERRIRGNVRAFVFLALGGPDLVTDDRAARFAEVRMCDADFDRAAELLVDCLREVGVSPDVLELSRRRLEDLRPMMVSA